MSNLEDSGLIWPRLATLPPEILAEILSHLDLKDLFNVSQTCKRLSAAAQIQEVWEKKASLKFGIRLKPRKNFESHSPKQFYRKVLLPYGRCLGLWQRQNFSHYGNLTQVVFDPSGCWKLRFITWETPKGQKIEKPLRPRDLLVIQLDEDGEDAEVQVLDDFVRCDECEVELGPDPSELSVRFPDCPDWTEEPELWNQHLVDYIMRNVGGRTLDRRSLEFVLHMEKFVVMFHVRREHRFARVDLDQLFRLDFSRQRQTLPDLIPPGIFKGTYGPHGVELIALVYRKSSPDSAADEPEVAEGLKLTGDSNVPFKQVTFRADLTMPLVYTNVEDQSDVEAMISGERVPAVGRETPVDSMRQIFGLPDSCRCRSSYKFEQCLARFKAECQIAGSDFRDPEFIAGQLVVFSADVFGVFFLQLHSFSFYQRVKENLAAKKFHQIHS